MNLRALLDSLPDEALLPVSWVKEQLAAAGGDIAADGPGREQVFTVNTLAAALHRSPSTIRGWCEKGELTASRVKGRWFIKHEAVERLLDGPQPNAESVSRRAIAPGANNRAGSRRARASGAPDVDLGAWKTVRKVEP